MRLRQIEVFHAVYSSGSMTSAAALLNVSQPSVSKVLAHAEQQLGYALFERNKGRLVPTPEAHRLFEHVGEVYQNLDKVRQVASNLRAPDRGRIRIASTPAFGLDVLPRAVTSYQRNHNGAVFDIETLHLDEINKALLESRTDIGLAFDPIASPGIEQKRLARGRFFVLAPPDSDFDELSGLDIDALVEHPFISLNSRGPLGRALSAYFASSDVEFNTVATVETYHIAKTLVSMGVGITIADEITAYSNTGGTVRVIPLEPAIHFDISAMWLGNAPLSIASNAFVEHLRSCIAGFMKRTPGT